MKGAYDVTAISKVPSSKVWELLLDAHSWPRWGTVDELVLERSGNISLDRRDTVGAVRIFRTGRVVTSEQSPNCAPSNCSPTRTPAIRS